MKRRMVGMLGGLLLASQGAWAMQQDVSGIGCASGALSLVTGAAFSATCTGDLRIETGTIIEAEQSIYLGAFGQVTMLGSLHAPQIVIIAGVALNLGEATTIAAGNSLGERLPTRSGGAAGGAVVSVSGADIELRNPYPVGGILLPLDSRDVMVTHGIVHAVPQPPTVLLMLAGAAAMLRLRHSPNRRAKRNAGWARYMRMSQTDHLNSHPNVTLEN